MHEYQKRYVLAMSHLTCNAHCNTDFDWTGTRHPIRLMGPPRRRSVTFVWKDGRALCWNPQTSEIIGVVCPFYLNLIDVIFNIVTAPNSEQLGVLSFLVSTKSRGACNGIL